MDTYQNLLNLHTAFKENARYADLGNTTAVTSLLKYDNLDTIIFILNTNGCSWLKKKGGGCFMCGYDYFNYSNACKSTQDIETQVKKGIRRYSLKNFGVRLFASSFLDNEEVPKKAQLNILSFLIKQKGLKRIWVESRPEYVTEEKVNKLAKILNGSGVELTVAMGLETLDDKIRSKSINKGFTLEAFEKATKLLQGASLKVGAYVLFKPPFVSEEDAVRDSVKTIEHCFEQNIDVSFCVTSIHPNTLLAYLHNRKQYDLPRLWSIVKVIQTCHNKKNRLYISEFDHSTASINVEPIFADGCSSCHVKLAKGLASYTATQSLSAFEGITCKCKDKWFSQLGSVLEEVA